MGIPRYFYEGPSESEIPFRLTNLGQCSTLHNYLRSNSRTLSMHNRLNILYQISINLKYLRDHSIVYNNLTPTTTFISKNLETKLSDLTNCYLTDENSPEFKSEFKKVYRNRFPYVFNCMDDARGVETYN